MAEVEQKLPATESEASTVNEQPAFQPELQMADTVEVTVPVSETADAAPVSAAPVKAEATDAAVEPAKAGRGRPRKSAKAEGAPKVRAAAPKNRTRETNKVAPVKADKPARVRTSTSATRSAPAQSSAPQKETIKMATKSKTTDFTASFKDAGEKARAAFEKSQAAFGDAGEFAKGNLEAVVESSKILANGMKAMGETYVNEGRSAYETMTADLKALAGVKSPTEFFELQSKLLRKNFDAAVAKGSKQSEDMLKLANEAFQPLSTRLSLAMEKFKKAA